MYVFVTGKNGERLMPTQRLGKVRHMLQDGRAVIAARNPFTIQLTYETTSYTQPVEICEDTGYQHVGLSVKSEDAEFVSAQYDLLPDEKDRHDACAKYRRTRRNRLRYRKPRFKNRRKQPPGERPPDSGKKKAAGLLHKFQQYQIRHLDSYLDEAEMMAAFRRWFDRLPRKMKRLVSELLQKRGGEKHVSDPSLALEDRNPAWLPPSLKNKADRQVDLIVNHLKVCPVTDVYVELGEFDVVLLKAVTEGKPLPEGIDYQTGPMSKYVEETLRNAVIHRDGHTCQICGRGLAEHAILHAHHMYYWRGQHGNSMDELIAVCERCHTQANHEESGKLWGLDRNVGSYAAPAFMNTVRWYIWNRLQEETEKLGLNVRFHMTYGAATKAARSELQVEKTHVNDAWCMGMFHPEQRAEEQHFRKRRRSSRVLEKFYDRAMVDRRTGRKASGAELSSGRTKRSVPRRNPQNARSCRGSCIRKGRRSIRRKRHPFQAGDVISCRGEEHVCRGTQCCGRYVLWHDGADPDTGKPVIRRARASDIRMVKASGAWEKFFKEVSGAFLPA